MAKIEDYELTNEQIKAVECIERAFRKARKLGVAFECLNSDIHAYSQKIFDDDACDTNDGDCTYIEPPQYSFMAHCNAGADDVLFFKEGVLDE